METGGEKTVEMGGILRPYVGILRGDFLPEETCDPTTEAAQVHQRKVEIWTVTSESLQID